MDPYTFASIEVFLVSTAGFTVLIYNEARKSQKAIKNIRDSRDYHFSNMENYLSEMTGCLDRMGGYLKTLEKSYNRLEKIFEKNQKLDV